MHRLEQLKERVNNRDAKIAVIGLGYVGMPLAVAFAEHFETIGFDINQEKVQQYKQGIDVTNEVGDEALKNSKVQFTWEEDMLKDVDIFVVAVPTPIDEGKSPDFRPLIGSSHTVGRIMKQDAIVVYESTVYPGATEEVCVPILEKESGMQHLEGFFVGYSPERINPSDKVHTLQTIVKVVSGCDDVTADILCELYGTVVTAGVYRAANIKVAEAAKVIENSQRDINIAFVNEISMIFDRLNIDTNDVLAAAGTKWNFLNFTPGLVGGHCIGVDPYYLAHKAQQVGHYPQIILAGRRINDGMGAHVASQLVKSLIEADIPVKGAEVLILGLTFKENTPDCRNTKVIDVIQELAAYGVTVYVHDPFASKEEAKEEYGLDLIESFRSALPVDAVVAAVSHDEYRAISLDDMRKFYKGQPVLVDVKSMYDKNEARKMGYVYWNL